MDSVHLMYLSVGSRDIAVQALYAAYSALAHRGSLAVTVHVYTDMTEVFEPLRPRVQIHELTAETIRAWRGPGNYPFRMKIAALAEMARSFPDERIFFADSDTFFVGELAPLFGRIDEHNAVLHRREYSVLTCPTGQLRRFRRRMSRMQFRGSAIDLDAEMWNSGAIGLHP